MKNDNLDMILYEIVQADNLEPDEEEAEAISFHMGGYLTLICC